MKPLARVFLSIVILLSGVFVQASSADISCSEYKAQSKSTEDAYDKEMHQNVLNLCQQPYWLEATRNFSASFDKSFWSGFFVNFRVVFEHIANHGLTPEFDKIVRYPKLNGALNDCYPGHRTSAFWFKASNITTDNTGTVLGLYIGFRMQYELFKRYSKYVDKAMDLPPLSWMSCNVPLLSKYSPKAAKKVIKGALVALPYLELAMFQWAHLIPSDDGDLKPVDNPNPDFKSVPDQVETVKSSTEIDRDELQQVTSQANYQMLKYDGVSTPPAKLSLQDSNSADTTAINPKDMKPGIDIVFSLCMESIARYNAGKKSTIANIVTSHYGANVVTMCGTFIDMARNAEALLANPEYRCMNDNAGTATDLAAAINAMSAQLPQELLSK